MLELHQFVSEKKLEGEVRTEMVIRMLVFDIASQAVFKSSDAVGINIANKIFSEIPEEAEAVKVGIKTNARDRSEEASLREKEIKKEVKLLVKDEKIVSDVKVNLASVQDTREWRMVRAIVATKVAGQMVHPRVMALRREG